MRRRGGFKEVERKLQGDFRFEKSALGQRARDFKISEEAEKFMEDLFADDFLEVSGED